MLTQGPIGVSASASWRLLTPLYGLGVANQPTGFCRYCLAAVSCGTLAAVDGDGMLANGH